MFSSLVSLLAAFSDKIKDLGFFEFEQKKKFKLLKKSIEKHTSLISDLYNNNTRRYNFVSQEELNYLCWDLKDILLFLRDTNMRFNKDKEIIKNDIEDYLKKLEYKLENEANYDG